MELENAVKEYRRQYYENHKDELKDKIKATYERNKDVRKEQMKAYNAANKERLKEVRSVKINCECGGIYCLSNKIRHLKCQKHINYLAKQQPTEATVE
jgi:hypothetical protein